VNDHSQVKSAGHSLRHHRLHRSFSSPLTAVDANVTEFFPAALPEPSRLLLLTDLLPFNKNKKTVHVSEKTEEVTPKPDGLGLALLGLGLSSIGIWLG